MLACLCAAALAAPLVRLEAAPPAACSKNLLLRGGHAVRPTASRFQAIFTRSELLDLGLEAGAAVIAVQADRDPSKAALDCHLSLRVLDAGPADGREHAVPGAESASRAACAALTSPGGLALDRRLSWRGDGALSITLEMGAGHAGAAAAGGGGDASEASVPALRLCLAPPAPVPATTVGDAAESTPTLPGALASSPPVPRSDVRALPDDDAAPLADDGPFIAVLAPAERSSLPGLQPLLAPGHHYDIRWASRGELGAIRIELLEHGRSGDTAAAWLLSDGVPDVGSWRWYLPPGAFADGANYQLRLVSTRLPAVEGRSGLFIIKSGELLYLSWLLLMAAMLATACCTVSVCKAVQQAREELRHAEHARRVRGRDAADGADRGDSAAVDGDGDTGADLGAADGETRGEWASGTLPEEELAAATASSFQCCICMERSIDTVLVPCGHSVACGPCAHGCAACPICRADIERIVKVSHK